MRRLGFVIPSYSIGKSLTTFNTAALLVEAGYAVDILTDHHLDACPQLAGVRFISSQPVEPPSTCQPTPLGRLSHFAENRLGALPGVQRGVDAAREFRWLPRVGAFTRWLNRQFRRDRYDCVFGFDPEGLIAASIVAAPRRLPVVYFSLELYLWDELRTAGRRLTKLIERACHRRAAFTIIQDSDRGEVLRRENRANGQTMVYMPVAGLEEPSRRRTHEMHDMLGIPYDQRIVMHVGGIYDWSRCLEFVHAASDLPEGWVAVLHGYPSEPEYLELLRREAGDRVYLSFNRLPRERMPGLISSADVGVVFYRDLGPGFRLISFASNRLVDFLTRGIPVIVTAFPGFRTMIDQYHCGVAVTDPNETAAAVQTIAADYDGYSERALRCYRERYDARLYIDDLYAKLASLWP